MPRYSRRRRHFLDKKVNRVTESVQLRSRVRDGMLRLVTLDSVDAAAIDDTGAGSVRLDGRLD